MSDQQTLRVDAYWRAWLGVVAFTFLVRFIVFYVLNRDPHPSFGVIYMIGTWVSIMVLANIEGRRIMSYLKSNYPQKWDDLYPITHSGLRWRSNSRLRSWIYSSDESDDPTLAALKLEYQDFIKLLLTVFFSYLFIVPILSF